MGFGTAIQARTAAAGVDQSRVPKRNVFRTLPCALQRAVVVAKTLMGRGDRAGDTPRPCLGHVLGGRARMSWRGVTEGRVGPGGRPGRGGAGRRRRPDAASVALATPGLAGVAVGAPS